ncbi:MAG: TIGR00266 family protein [Moraxellaceae bacterium]|nr:TIGR00266 family protein [Moraxellaceae bacterium]
MTHKVQIAGYAGSHEQAAVVAAFAKLFRLDDVRAAELLARAPLVIKEGIDAETAEKYRANLEKIGLRVEIIAPAAAPLELALEPVPTPVGAASAAIPPVAGLSVGVNSSAQPAPDAPRWTPPPAPPEPEQPGFKFRIDGRPDYAFLTVQLAANETLKVEASAMATMDTSLKMKTKLRGGLGRFLTGESIFVNEFTAENVSGEIGIAPAAPGDLAHVYLRGNDVIFLQNAAFVACDPRVELATKWQGLMKGFFSGESLFLIRASGEGDLWFNTYGGLIELEVDGDYVVDTGNIVAFTEGLDYRISKVGGYKSLFFSGEGLVCRFSGKGKVWIQTRTSQAFVSWAHWFRPVKNN